LRKFYFVVLVILWTVPALAQDADGTLRRIRVPILMYHYISEPPPGADAYRIELSITPDIFRAHMQYLEDEGYTPVSLYDLDAALIRGAALPAKPVILTFDDGHIDHYTNVFPILKEYGFTATFFVITARLDERNADYINWEQAEEMATTGMNIEPHTKNHFDLRNRNRDFLVYEVLGSIESVAAHLENQPTMFSYPAGRYDENTLDLIAEANIRRAVTTQPGSFHTTHNQLEVKRLRITGNMSVAGLSYLLTTRDFD
jgi:peptidoglycan/xylan/chitin deacetylase (PgdA/CDA1 family)